MSGDHLEKSVFEMRFPTTLWLDHLVVRVPAVRAPPHGVCGNLFSALKLVANLKGKESFTEVVNEGIKEKGGGGVEEGQ